MQIASRISSWTSGETPTPPVADTTQIGVSLGAASNYATVGIYTANAIDPTTPTEVDWGDGTTDSIIGDISQLIHTYAVAGRDYTVTISDNISSLALSANNSTWYGTTTYNQNNIRSVNLSHRVTSIPAYGFYNIIRMNDFFAGSSGYLTLGEHAFHFTIAQSFFEEISFDFSGRTCNQIPLSCFQGNALLKYFDFPQGVVSIADSAFYGCFQNDITANASLVIPEGVTTIGPSVFRTCYRLSEITLPSSLLEIGDQTFRACRYLSTIRANSMLAPTVYSNTFGTTTASTQTGNYVKSSGNNTLYIPAGATGYTSGVWNDMLLNSARCGFTLVEV